MTYGQLRDQLLRIHMPTCVAVLKRHAVLAHDLGDPPPVYVVYNRLRPGETFDDRHIELLTPVSAVHFDFVHLVADRFQALPSHRFRVLTSKWYNNSDFSDMLAGHLSDCQTETEFVQQMRAYFRQIPQDIVNLPNDTRFLLNGQLSVAFVHGTVTFPVPGVASPHLRGIFRIGARQAGTGYLYIIGTP